MAVFVYLHVNSHKLWFRLLISPVIKQDTPDWIWTIIILYSLQLLSPSSISSSTLASPQAAWTLALVMPSWRCQLCFLLLVCRWQISFGPQLLPWGCDTSGVRGHLVSPQSELTMDNHTHAHAHSWTNPSTDTSDLSTDIWCMPPLHRHTLQTIP